MPPVLVRYLATAVLARLADEGVRVAFVLLALAATGEAWVGGILVGAFMLPHVLAAPAVGALADRARRRRPLYTSLPAGRPRGTLIAVCLGYQAAPERGGDRGLRIADRSPSGAGAATDSGGRRRGRSAGHRWPVQSAARPDTSRPPAACLQPRRHDL